MINGWLLIGISLLYISLLFLVAWHGDRKANQYYRHPLMRRMVYGFSLAVYFSSWTFFGAVGRATRDGLEFLPIYLGPLLLYLFGAPILKRIIFISKRNNTTSIADFIASRYGKSPQLAALIAFIAMIGSIPYIALQLKAIAMGFSVLTDQTASSGLPAPHWLQDTGWYITLILAAFTILFGTRHLDATEHHRGMIQAIAFESLIKMFAFILVGLFAAFVLFGSPLQLFAHLKNAGLAHVLSPASIRPSTFISETLVSMLAIICLPRQFHVTVVENTEYQDFNLARWIMPVFLVLASLFVLPIAAAGLFAYGPKSTNADILVLNLPMITGYHWLAVLAFLGGASAAAAMVIVSSVANATMFSNELIMPILLRLLNRLNRRSSLRPFLLGVRRVIILLLLLASYGFYRIAAADYSLTAFGLLSFVAAAQFGPALLGAVLWRRSNHTGAFWGLVGGFTAWVFTLLLPTLISVGWMKTPALIEGLGLGGVDSLQTRDLFGISLDPVTFGTILSLGTNLFLFVTLSLLTRQRIRERIQIAAFFQEPQPRSDHPEEIVREGDVTVADLRALAERFLGTERAKAIFQQFEQRHALRLSAQRIATPYLMKHVERQLAAVIGASTARVVLESTLTGRDMQIEDVVSIVDEASQAMTFSRELLQSAIENITLAVVVVDAQHRVVSWNQRYLDLFMFPKGFVRTGRPITDLIRYNLITANLPARRVDEIIRTRLGYMREGLPNSYERQRSDGTILLVQGNPVPGGGYVTTFQDITTMRRTEQALKETNTYLEQRVKERTQELQVLNDQLLKAKSTAEQANQSKTRFLAAASHDLLQPLNAARLFTSALAGKPLDGEIRELVTHIDSSLGSAEEIISTLLDISKLDAGALEPQWNIFPVNDLLRHLTTEFDAIAREQGLTLDAVPCSAWVRSDSQLLRRVVQNFLSNAMRYTTRGRILVGCRRLKGYLRIEVWDTGPGIPQDKLEQIFEEFRRLQQGRDHKGLGLGLAIVDRISHVLDHPVGVRSWQGRGSVFCITVPLAPAEAVAETPVEPSAASRSVSTLRGLTVLCIDNDQSILDGMVALLGNWQCEVLAADSLESARRVLGERVPNIILADYQLDNDENGLDAMDALRSNWHVKVPGILVTGLVSAEVRAEAMERGYQVLFKPVKPAALRALVNKMLRRRQAG
ncbi:hybrid sensor histidine kinase/response regulator [Mangrovitalea sediminis]|uniref:hybrid sensor histidine kinase/response regulator n=1 Tax=Mangrovitalea sediminis TaxID=1982043 RepID=UPI000BE4D47C|nr:NahK/ErcS family hybrid sensor histidine kinase/response regulator [Mangrovitalea sediminis]